MAGEEGNGSGRSLQSLFLAQDVPTNARTLVAMATAVAGGAFVFSPVFAQDAMARGSGSAMSHDAMHKGSMMKKGATKHDAMKMRKPGGDAMSSGG